ncbi:MAG: branched-chain amino acid ABC transporter permease [Deltaproteobacteria bacterium]|nr:branched-chain amino acid ABC transporter permease [Deltaproteobacteria bacterium]
MSLDSLYALLYDGFVLGGKIALAAIPYLLVYKYLMMLNFAFGEVMTFGAYASYLLLEKASWPIVPVIVATVLLTALLGVVIELVAYRPVIDADDRHLPLVTSVGVSIVLQNLYQALFGSRVIYADRLNLSPFWLFASLGGALVVVLGILTLTPLGQQIAAVASNRRLSMVMGIRPGLVYSSVFALASGIAALAGMFEMADNGIAPTMGFQLGLLAFAAAVLARLKSLPAAIAWAFVIGIAIQFAQARTVLNDQILWVILVLAALLSAARSRLRARKRRVLAGEDRGR